MSVALKHTPITRRGEPEPVAASILFGAENPWFHDLAEQLQHNDPDMLTAVIEFDEMYDGYDYECLFPLITCPVLIIQGSQVHGGALTNEEIERTLTLLPSATVSRMETVGHPLHAQEKDTVLLAMSAFLKTL
jgi:pimeloyl-ACP methyl ester carboxylesterase